MIDGDKPSVLICPSVVPYVSGLLEYKFQEAENIDSSQGLLASWESFKGPERDRFYIMCAYMLKNVFPGLWEAVLDS